MSDEITTAAWEGINLCRGGSWSQGVTRLTRVAREKHPDTKLPGIFYSYLGYGIALCEHRVREGLVLCEQAVKTGFYEPENYLNLSRAYLLRKNRRAAVKWLNKGLKVDPNHEALISLQQDMGVRKRPIIPFLSRDATFNILLGKMRHNMTKRR